MWVTCRKMTSASAPLAASRAAVNKSVKIEQDERGYLTDDARKLLAEKVLNRLESAEAYEKKNVPLRIIMQSQARHLAMYLRGERSEYAAFVMEW